MFEKKEKNDFGWHEKSKFRATLRELKMLDSGQRTPLQSKIINFDPDTRGPGEVITLAKLTIKTNAIFQ